MLRDAPLCAQRDLGACPAGLTAAAMPVCETEPMGLADAVGAAISVAPIASTPRSERRVMGRSCPFGSWTTCRGRLRALRPRLAAGLPFR